MRIKISKQAGRYVHKSNPINYRQMGSLIREGNTLQIIDSDGIDFTKETLAHIALWDKSDFSTAQVLAFIIDEDKLYEIIEDGGIASHINKQVRSL